MARDARLRPRHRLNPFPLATHRLLHRSVRDRGVVWRFPGHDSGVCGECTRRGPVDTVGVTEGDGGDGVEGAEC